MKGLWTSLLHSRAIWIIVAINICVFVATLLGLSSDTLVTRFDLGYTLTHPWTLLTSIFVHESLTHLLINMAILLPFGAIFCQQFSQKAFVWVFLLGGLAGALSFAFASVFEAGSMVAEGTLAGSSAAVVAVIVALMYKFSKSFGIILLAVFASGIVGPNPGGTIAHIAGVFVGIISASILCRRLALQHERQSKSFRDPLIIKAEESGFASLTDEERASLFSSKSNAK